MPNFCHPGQPPTEIYPDRATRLIEELRRFVGHDRLVQQTNHYHAEGRITNLVRMARFREDQPLIEAFETYEKATRRSQRSLRSIPKATQTERASFRERVCKYVKIQVVHV